MSWRTSNLVLTVRDIGRRFGVNSLVNRTLDQRAYEGRFRSAMLEVLHPGDVVWDVGANVGMYSKMFSDVVGPSGRVFAFEPSPRSRAQLSEAVVQRRNIVVVPAALGDRDGTVGFAPGGDRIGATGQVREGADGKGTGIEVLLRTGDSVILSGDARVPNFVKIDVEGFELEVLRGLHETLQAQSLRAVCIEVHFGLLRERGFRNGPRDIESLTSRYGFSSRWPDSSHLVASRPDGCSD